MIKNNELVGFAFLLHYPSACFLNYFAIKPIFQKKGMGSLLLNHVVECAKGKPVLLTTWEPDVDYEDLYELWEDGRCKYVSGFIGTAYRLNEHGDPTWSEDYMFDDDQLYYVGLGKEPALCRQAYSSVDEIVEELKNNLNDLLPDDFDIRSRLCFIAGTYFG